MFFCTYNHSNVVMFISQLVLLAVLLESCLAMNNKNEMSNSMDDLECAVDIGPLKRTMHRVKGRVCAVDLDTILIENFHFDGLGAGVFINIGKDSFTLRDEAM